MSRKDNHVFCNVWNVRYFGKGKVSTCWTFFYKREQKRLRPHNPTDFPNTDKKNWICCSFPQKNINFDLPHKKNKQTKQFTTSYLPNTHSKTISILGFPLLWIEKSNEIMKMKTNSLRLQKEKIWKIPKHTWSTLGFGWGGRICWNLMSIC